MNRSQALIEFSANPMLLIDENYTTKYANPAFVIWSGMKQSDLAGKSIFDIIKIPHQQEHVESQWMYAEPVLTSGKPWSAEVELMHPDERTITSNMDIYPILNARGEMAECIVQFNDSTERNELARRIVETQKDYRDIVESSLDGIMIIQKREIGLCQSVGCPPVRLCKIGRYAKIESFRYNCPF